MWADDERPTGARSPLPRRVDMHLPDTMTMQQIELGGSQHLPKVGRIADRFWPGGLHQFQRPIAEPPRVFAAVFVAQAEDDRFPAQPIDNRGLASDSLEHAPVAARHP